MPENKKISPTPARGDQSKIDGACFKAKALRVAARSRTYGDHAQGLVLFGPPKEAVEIFQESEMTNTEEVNKGIYFGYPCRRRSCAIVKIPAPCVNKMISHIQDVESKIQEHLKKLSELQKRMRKLWPEYFKLVVLFNEMKLASIQRDSQESVQKILAVQEESSSLMQHILDFFKTLKDGSCENDG
uniref:Coiled-coil domain containing 178 n=1 Tax=Microcebus murinus TaxID=30608 RepID=A0A8C5XPX0_MICMU